MCRAVVRPVDTVLSFTEIGKGLVRIVAVPVESVCGEVVSGATPRGKLISYHYSRFDMRNQWISFQNMLLDKFQCFQRKRNFTPSIKGNCASNQKFIRV